MEKDLIGSLPQWVKDFDEKTGIETMQDFFLYTSKKWSNERQLGHFTEEGEIEYFSFREIHDLAMHVGSFLMSKGLKPGDRVGVYSENRIESGIFLQACHLFGFVAVFTFDPAPAYYPRYTLVNAEVSCIYISQKKAEYFDVLFKGKFSDALKFVILNEPKEGVPEGVDTYIFDEIIDTPIIPSLPPVKPEDPCTIVYSSGTVGAPKGVVISHDAMVSGVFYIKVSVPVKYHDVHVSFLPMAHILERIGYLIFNYRGALIVFASQGTLHAVQDMKKAHITGGPIIPSILSKLHAGIMEKINTPFKKGFFNVCKGISGICRTIGFRSRLSDFLLFQTIKDKFGGNIQWFAVAGDVFDKKVHDDLSAIFGSELLAIYGLSECAGPLYVCPSCEYKPGTVGRPMPYVQTKFGPKQTILIKTPAMFTKYWKNHKTTLEAFVDGWYDTGDRGEIDPETHHLIVTGRAYDTFEFKPGVDLALPFLRFTYSKYVLVSDILLKPLEEYNCLVAIIVVDKKIGDHFTKKTLTPEEFKELLKNKDFIEYVHLWTNNFGKDANLREGSAIAAARLTDEGFTQENGLVTATGKLKYVAACQKYEKEFEEMRQEIADKIKAQQELEKQKQIEQEAAAEEAQQHSGPHSPKLQISEPQSPKSPQSPRLQISETQEQSAENSAQSSQPQTPVKSPQGTPNQTPESSPQKETPQSPQQEENEQQESNE